MNIMKDALLHRILIAASMLALVPLAVAPILYLAGATTLDTTKTILLSATLLWFATAPFWMKKE